MKHTYAGKTWEFSKVGMDLYYSESERCPMYVGVRARIRNNRSWVIRFLLLPIIFIMLGNISISEIAYADSTFHGICLDDYQQSVFSEREGLSCGEANTIAETPDGMLWVGTEAGLYQFDRQEFRLLTSYHSIRNVNCLYVDADGRLWVGTVDNGLSILEGDRVTRVIDPSVGLPTYSVKGIIHSADGLCYVGTTGSMQVLSLKDDLKKITTIPEISYVLSIAADEKGNVAVVTIDGTLYLLNGGNILSSIKAGDGNVFLCCEFDKDGLLLAAKTSNQIAVFELGDIWYEQKETLESDVLKYVRKMKFLDTGDLLAVTDIGIVVIGPDRQLEMIDTGEFNYNIKDVIVDDHGDIWFANNRRGLLCMSAPGTEQNKDVQKKAELDNAVRSNDFRNIYSIVGMTGRYVNTIAFWQGNYYFGTDAGLDAVDAGLLYQVSNELTEQLIGARIRCMLVDNEDHLWICTYGKGLIEIEPDGTQYMYNRENSTVGNRTRVVQQLKDGTIVVSSDVGLDFIREHQTVDHVVIPSMVLSFTEMADGRLVAGTDANGIVILKDHEVDRMLDRKDGLTSGTILRTVPNDKNDGIFVVTSNGLCYMDSDESIRRLDHFPYFNNFDIKVLGDTLFVTSSAGVFVISREELFSEKDSVSYQLLDYHQGLDANLTGNSWQYYDTETHELFLCCDSGVFVMNTDDYSAKTQVFAPYPPIPTATPVPTPVPTPEPFVFRSVHWGDDVDTVVNNEGAYIDAGQLADTEDGWYVRYATNAVGLQMLLDYNFSSKGLFKIQYRYDGELKTEEQLEAVMNRLCNAYEKKYGASFAQETWHKQEDQAEYADKPGTAIIRGLLEVEYNWQLVDDTSVSLLAQGLEDEAGGTIIITYSSTGYEPTEKDYSDEI